MMLRRLGTSAVIVVSLVAVAIADYESKVSGSERFAESSTDREFFAYDPKSHTFHSLGTGYLPKIKSVPLPVAKAVDGTARIDLAAIEAAGLRANGDGLRLVGRMNGIDNANAFERLQQLKVPVLGDQDAQRLGLVNTGQLWVIDRAQDKRDIQGLLTRITALVATSGSSKNRELPSSFGQTLTTIGLGLDGLLAWDPDLVFQTRAELQSLEQLLTSRPLSPARQQDLVEVAESLKATADVFNQTLGSGKPSLPSTLFSSSAHRATFRLTVELIAVGTQNIPVRGCRIQTVHKSGWSQTSAGLTPKVLMDIVPVSQSLYAVDRSGTVISDRYEIKIGQALAADATIVLRADHPTACST